MPVDTAALEFGADGLITAVVVHHESREVLMVAYMNAEALQRTVETGLATFWSRSRSKFWVKGESSGQTMTVKSIRTDCDADALVVAVDPVGPACHDGYRSCFYRELRGDEWEIVEAPMISPEDLYGK
jgi:phosphoribosyl-AMP cyclohydrolase